MVMATVTPLCLTVRSSAGGAGLRSSAGCGLAPIVVGGRQQLQSRRHDQLLLLVQQLRVLRQQWHRRHQQPCCRGLDPQCELEDGGAHGREPITDRLPRLPNAAAARPARLGTGPGDDRYYHHHHRYQPERAEQLLVGQGEA